MKIVNLIRKENKKTITYILERVGKNNDLILNIGSSSTRFGEKCFNLDIQKQDGVDIIGDAHELPFLKECFNICILSAVLQYCKNPFQVAKEVHRVLIQGGHAIIDAPFIQQYCLGTPDLYRFSKDGLKEIFGKYLQIIQCDISISGGSALAFYLQGITGVSITNRYIRFLVVNIISLILYPVSFLKFKNRHEVAGAFILLARKVR